MIEKTQNLKKNLKILNLSLEKLPVVEVATRIFK